MGFCGQHRMAQNVEAPTQVPEEVTEAWWRLPCCTQVLVTACFVPCFSHRNVLFGG